MDLRDGEERLQPSEEAQDGSCGDSRKTRAATSIFSHTVSIFGKGRARQSPPLAKPSPPPQTLKNGIPSQQNKPTASPSPRPSHPNNHGSPTKLGHLASVLRSKNAGPYEITFDIMFDSESVYNLVRQSGLLSPKTAADALKVPQNDIIWCGFFNPARAFKVTIPRVRAGKKVAAGSFMEDDAHGSQQHLGLVNLELSTTILEGLGKLEVV